MRLVVDSVAVSTVVNGWVAWVSMTNIRVVVLVTESILSRMRIGVTRATGETREATGIKVIIVADILLTILLVLVVTVLMSIVGRLLVGVNVSVLATGILAAIDLWLLLVIKVEGLVSTATISVTSETLGVTIIETITSFRLVIVGRSGVLLDSVSVTALLTVAVRGGGNTGESNKSE